MTLSFAGRLDHEAVLRAVDQLVDLVASPAVEQAWDQESVLPGLSVGGLVRHLVSQPECAVEFLDSRAPHDAETVSLLDYHDRFDWLDAPIESIENTSIRDDFNELAAGGPADSIAVLERSGAALPEAIASAGETTYVPWQDCCLLLDDFLVVRLVEIVVHADDLAASTGQDAPVFDDEVLHPVLTLLAALSVRRHGQSATLRALARTERATGSVSAFG